jgi:glycerol-1-phosphatase
VAGSIPEIDVDALVARYAVLLLDAYGVLVTSGGALPGAAELVGRLNRQGKPYFVLTNDASKLPATAVARYRGYGLHLDADRIITSGSLLAPYFDAHGLRGRRAVVLGPPDSIAYVEQAGGKIVAPGDPFDVLVVADESGYDFLDTLNAVLGALVRAIDRGETVRLVLPNPDVIYPAPGGVFGFASGSIALVFEAAMRARYPARDDLRFDRLGKPHDAMFREALRRSGTRDMVMVGDQLETDVRGALAFGLDGVLLATGVAAVSATAMDGLRPTYVMRALAAA